MKYFSFLILLVSFAAFGAKRLPVMTGKIYVPEGFDTNDMVEVVVSGRLPDGCHRNPTYEVHRSGNTFNVFLFAYYVPLRGCKKRSLPYMDKVNLGMLPDGDYRVMLKGVEVPRDSAKLIVKKAVSQLQDDFKYGNVMGIREEESGRTIELIGTNPLSCLRFDKLVSEIQEKVIVLRPQFKEEGECLEHPTPFSIKYEVPYLKDHPRGILLHVRVMDGRSYNYLYQNKLRP